MPSSAPTRPAGRMGIGQVLRQLHDEFPDITISKIRFLEAAGLVQPERTASGYRKFTATDLDRLRYVLRAQRDHYLPLKVIRKHLDAMSRGLEPPASAGEVPRAPRPAEPVAGGPEAAAPELRLSRVELMANSGLDEGQLAQLEEFGLVRAQPGTAEFDAATLAVAATAARMAAYGLEPRHLRTFKTAADRAAGLIDQVATPVARQRGEDAAARAAVIRTELADLATELHAALVGKALHATH